MSALKYWDGSNWQLIASPAGVAVGGTTGQFLRKSSSATYDTAWATLSSTDIGTALSSRVQPLTLPTASGTIALLDSFAISSSSVLLSTGTGAQALFSSSNSNITNGSLYVIPDTTYMFEAQFYVTGMSATSGNLSFDVLGAGTASITSITEHSFGSDTTTPTTAAAQGGAFNTTVKSAGNIVSAGTGTAVYATVKGLFRVAASSPTNGTIVPSIYITTSVATAVLQSNAYFRATPIGSSTLTSFGAWS
jgi:hypothetical protein